MFSPIFSFLFSYSVDLQKANLEAQNQSNSGGSSSPSGNPSPLASALPLAQLLSKPGALNALSSLSALGGLSDLLGNVNNVAASRPVQTTGVHRSKSYSSRVRSPSGDKSKMDRNKFAPYWVSCYFKFGLNCVFFTTIFFSSFFLYVMILYVFEEK